MHCGHPVVGAEASKLLIEAADMAIVGQHEISLRKIQQAVKLEEKSWLLRLKLGILYDAKASSGEVALQRLADREFSEAMRLGPLEREVHAARIERIARRGGLELLRAEYTEKQVEQPIFAECLRMVDAMEKASKLTMPQESIPPPAENYRAKMFLVASLLTGVGTFGMMVKMIVKSQNDADYVFVGRGDFWASLVCLTGTMILGLEFLRASGKLKK